MRLHKILTFLLLAALAARTSALDLDLGKLQDLIGSIGGGGGDDAGSKPPGYGEVVDVVTDAIKDAAKRGDELAQQYLDEVSEDPGDLISKEDLQGLVASNSFVPQKAGTRTITLQGTQGDNGIVDYQPSGWTIKESVQGGRRKETKVEENEPTFTYPFGVGPLLLNQCTEHNYTKSSPCYNSKHWDAESAYCKGLMDSASFMGVGFDGRGYYSSVSRKVSLIQRPCSNNALFLGQMVPDIMTVFGVFHTEAETQSFQSVDDYMRYVRNRAGLSNQKGIFTSEASKQSKATSFGFNGGAIGTLVGAGVGAYVGGPAGAMMGAQLGGAIGGSIEAGYGEGSGSSSSSESGTSSSEFEQTDESSNNQGSTHSFFAMMFVKVILYELMLDEIKPTDLSLNFLKDYMDLPVSYYTIGAEVDYQKFLIRWGTHYITSAKFGGQMKVTKTLKTETSMSQGEFASYAETEFKSMFSTLQSSYKQKSGGGGFLGLSVKSKSAEQSSSARTETSYSSTMDAENRRSQDYSKEEFTNTMVEVEGGIPEIAEALMDFYTPAFKPLFHEWVTSIKDYVKPFDFQLKVTHELLDMRMDDLFPAGDFDFGCMGADNPEVEILVEPETNRRYYIDTRVKFDGVNTTEIPFRVYCKYNNRDEFAADIERRRLSLERATNVYMIEGPFPTSSFELPAGQAGCEEKVLSQFNLFSGAEDIIPFSRLMAEPFLLVMNLRQDIPELTPASAKYKMMYRNGMWYASEPNSPYVNLYDGCKVPEGDVNATKICFENFILTYRESSGFFFVNRIDFQRSKLAMPSLPNWLSGAAAARAESLTTLSDTVDSVEQESIAIPCNVKWVNSYRLDPNRDSNCIHFTASSEGDIFVLFASIPKDYNTWHYLHISTQGVSFYKGFNLQMAYNKVGVGVLGDDNLFESFFACISQKDNIVHIQYGKSNPSSDVGKVFATFPYAADDNIGQISYYSFGSGDRRVSMLDVRLTKELAKIECADEDQLVEDGFCVFICHDECDGCKEARKNSACHACKHVRVEHGAEDGWFECFASCPPGYTLSASSQGLCEECPAGSFKSEAGNQTCTSCPLGQISSAAGAAICTPCESGTFSDFLGSTTCKSCEPGTFSDSGASSCPKCENGSFSAAAGQSQCQLCPPGKYASAKGLAECTECDAGFYAEAEGQSSCDQCLPGTTSERGSSSCDTKCSAGQTSSHSPSDVTCSDCLPGSYSSNGNDSVCTTCPEGRFQPYARGPYCFEANVGNFVNGTGATEQTSCYPGSYASGKRNTGCSLCPAGKFADQLGSAQCVDCPANSISTAPGSTTCTKCPALYYALPGSTKCIRCPPISDQSDINSLCYTQVKFSSCSQSSHWRESSVCGNAIDAILDTNVYSKPGCAATAHEDSPHWKADFPSGVSLYAIVLLAIADYRYKSQSTNIKVEAFDGQGWRQCSEVTEIYSSKVVVCRMEGALSVRIRKNDRDHLTLCEVTAYEWTRRDICAPLSAPNADTNCYEKLTLTGCSQTSDFSDWLGPRTCDKAYDGKTGIISDCAVTLEEDNATWVAGFLSAVDLRYVVLRGTTGSELQSQGVRLEAFDGEWRLCQLVEGQFDRIVMSCDMTGVTRVRVLQPSRGHLSLCEIEAFGLTVQCPALTVPNFDHSCYKQLPITQCHQSSLYRYDTMCSKALDKQVSSTPLSNCAVTLSESDAAWYGSFEYAVNVNYIVLHGRTDRKDQSTNVQIDVYDGSAWRYCDEVTQQYDHVIASCYVENAVRVRVTRQSREQLALCEVQAFGTVLRCPPLTIPNFNTNCYNQLVFDDCEQTSDWTGHTCHRAIDGLATLQAGDQYANCAVANPQNAAWTGHFPLAADVDYIVLYRAPDCCRAEATNVRIEIFDGSSWRLCDEIHHQFDHVISSCFVKHASSVRVTQLVAAQYLTLCEVQAFGKPLDVFAHSCPVGSYQQGFEAGTCTTCPGFDVSNIFPPCYKKLPFSYCSGSSVSLGHNCEKAYDGSYHSLVDCSMTNMEPAAWWNAGFGGTRVLSHVVIRGRTFCHDGSMNCWHESTNLDVIIQEAGVGWRSCGRTYNLQHYWVVPCHSNLATDVKFHLLTHNHLTLCEVEAYGPP